jgi:hypothetical protein
MQASSIRQPTPANIFDKVIPLIASPQDQLSAAAHGDERLLESDGKCALAANSQARDIDRRKRDLCRHHYLRVVLFGMATDL